MTHLLNCKELAGQIETAKEAAKEASPGGAEEVMFVLGFWRKGESRWDRVGGGKKLLCPCLPFPASTVFFCPVACVCVTVGLYMCLKWHNRGFRFFAVSFCVIVLNVLSSTQHTLSTVTLFTLTICHRPAWASLHSLSTSCGCHLVYQ